jgi:ABC-type transport system substrate-binding protein
MRRPAFLLLLATLAAVVAACGSQASSSSSSSSTAAARPSSPAHVTIVSPQNGAVFTGGSIPVMVQVTGANIVQQTSKDISPTQGHVHLFLDNNLTYMSYTLSENLPVSHPGTYVLRAEFVASDHVPFNPRVVTPDVLVTVR